MFVYAFAVATPCLLAVAIVIAVIRADRHDRHDLPAIIRAIMRAKQDDDDKKPPPALPAS